MSSSQSPSTGGAFAQILLLADPLSGEGIKRWLTLDPPLYRVVDSPADLVGAPRLVIWALTSQPPPAVLVAELRQLRDRWHPAPILLLVSGAFSYAKPFLLDLPLQGLLEGPDPQTLQEAAATLLAGGRMVDIAGGETSESTVNPAPPMGLGQWLLVSGLQQIDAELRVCARLLDSFQTNGLGTLLVRGRRRELLAARALLLWLWGPLSLAWGSEAFAAEAPHPSPEPPVPSGAKRGPSGPGLSLTLRQRDAEGIWDTLRQRLQSAVRVGPDNHSGQLLAFDGLRAERKRDLLLALLEQLDQLRHNLQGQEHRVDTIRQRWSELQPALRQEALRQMAGPYVQLSRDGQLQPVAETLLRQSDLNAEDPDLPDPQSMLAALFEARPLVVDGRLRAADEPQAVLYLEMLLANWLVRSAEQISGQVLAASADWPELRRYLLQDNLLPTRNLERLRNQLNAQERWFSLVKRPIRLYESKRPLFCLKQDGIGLLDLTEPRDAELKRLPWPQQLVTLALEIRDALAPQAQHLVRAFGDLVVVVLTRVVGRAIGLVGRGIAQGMGRSLGR